MAILESLAVQKATSLLPAQPDEHPARSGCRNRPFDVLTVDVVVSRCSFERSSIEGHAKIRNHFGHARDMRVAGGCFYHDMLVTQGTCYLHIP